MNVYVYSKKSSRYRFKRNNKIISKLKNIFNDLVVVDYENFIYNKQIKYLIVSGGDGTLHNIINQCQDNLKNIIFGYIPTGTANDFGHNYKLNKINKAIKAIKDNVIKEVPLIEIDDELVLYGVSIGNMSDVSIKSHHRLKKLFKKTVYKINGIKYLFCKKSNIKINYGDKNITQKLKVLLITNSMYLGGMKISKKNVSDGIAVIPIKNIIDVIKVFFLRKFTKSKELIVKNVEVFCEDKWCVDGEKYHYDRAMIRISENKIRLLSKNT